MCLLLTGARKKKKSNVRVKCSCDFPLYLTSVALRIKSGKWTGRTRRGVTLGGHTGRLVGAAPGSVLLGARAGELVWRRCARALPEFRRSGSRIVRMQRKDVPSAVTEDKVGIGLRLNGQLLVSVCPFL